MYRNIQHIRRNGGLGMTLVEVIVVVSMFTILSLAIFNGVVQFYQLNAYTIAQSYQIDHARRGLQYLVRDLREMIYADDGTFPLVSMASNTIAFYSDIDRDNSVEYVEYQLSSTTLYKRIFNATGSPPEYSTTTPDEVYTISEYVQNSLQSIPIFVYHDEVGAAATASTTLVDVRYVTVELIINIDPIKDPGEFMLRSSAALRNLKTTL